MSELPDDSLLYQHASCGLLLTDTTGLVLRANATLCRWLGTPAGDLVGRVRIHDYLPVGTRVFLHTHCLPILQVEGSVSELQVDLRSANGARMPLLVNIVRRQHGARLVDEWSLFAVTERRRYERELLAARRSAEEALAAREEAESQLREINAALSNADHRKDEFLATLSHELRNPLAPMRSALEVLKLDRDVAPATRHLLSMFDRQLHHLTHLVDDLMEVSRITEGRLALRRAPLLLASIVQSAVEETAEALRCAGHRLSVTIDAPDAVVDADATRLVQVLVNLLENAAQFTPDGGEIGVHLWTEGDTACLAVRDNGVGIPDGALVTIFGMFSQVQPALERSRGGLGVGLSLARGILELHGGSIEAHSPGAGHGSTFTLTLPLAAAMPAPAPAPEPPAAVAPTSVVVVDDNVDAADTLVMFLELSGCEARTAYTGTQALALLAERMPAVALFDIGLPDMTGYELARRARQLPGGAGMLLIAATGWGQDSDKRMALDAGFDHHLTKPVDFDKLRALMGHKG